MASTPPIRTVHDKIQAKLDAPPTPVPAVEKVYYPRVSNETPVPGLPAAANILLQELKRYDLLDSVGVRQLFEHLGDRTRMLTDRNKAARALVSCGLLTEYQRDRIESGSSYGLVIGNYRVRNRLNGGTVGIVFEAVHATLKRTVAIKTLPADEETQPAVVNRFRNEMEMLSRLEHPHVVKIFDAGTLPASGPDQLPLHYAVLEFVSGGDLEQYVYKHGCQSIGIACEWGRQIASGLAAAHAVGLVHRDLKPSNILLTAERIAKVSDFGLARHYASTMTPVSSVLGSLEFMPPEQLSDPTTVGPASDIFGLGASLFWVLTGQLPYPKCESAKRLAQVIQSSAPRRLKEMDPNVPDSIDQMIARMMNRYPGNRPSALEVVQEITRFANPHELVAGTHTHKLDSMSNAVAVKDPNQQLRNSVHYLTELVASKSKQIEDASFAVLTALSEMALLCGERPGEQRRICEYVQTLINHLCRTTGWTQFSDKRYQDLVIRCIPCRNVGLAAVPDSLLTQSALSEEEEKLLEQHTIHGCTLLDKLTENHGQSLEFLRLARSILRSHHERWNGSGFPDGLTQEHIPHAARLIAMAEAYDTLRRPMSDGTPGLSHDEAVLGLIQETDGLFDPCVTAAFTAVQNQFETIYDNFPDDLPDEE